MKRRGEARGSRRAGRRRPGTLLLAVLVLSLPAAVSAAAFAAAGCGGSAGTAELAPFVGRWERVEAGAPNPDSTLDIERDGDGVRLRFASHANGMSQTVAGAVDDGHVACTLAMNDDLHLMPARPGAPSSGVATAPPTSVSLQLSLDGNGQLIVDLVLADGTLEPIWIYQLVDGVSPPASDGVSPPALGTL